MNARKWKQLFDAARKKAAPVPPPDFAAGVLRAIRSERRPANAATLSLADQLNLLFPRLAWAAAAIITLSVAADWALTAAGVPGVGAGVSQISAQWFLIPNGL